MNELYNRIEALAIERGMSVWALCQKTGISGSRMTALKQNRDASLSAQNTKKIADALGVSVDRILYGEEDASRVVHVNLDKKLPEMRSIFAKFTERELVYWISEMTAELQRRKLAEDAAEPRKVYEPTKKDGKAVSWVK